MTEIEHAVLSALTFRLGKAHGMLARLMTTPELRTATREQFKQELSEESIHVANLLNELNELHDG